MTRQAGARMAKRHASVLDDLVSEALRLDGDGLDVDSDGALVCRMRDSFGEDAFRVEVRRA
jgi:hypothetical protein